MKAFELMMVCRVGLLGLVLSFSALTGAFAQEHASNLATPQDFAVSYGAASAAMSAKAVASHYSESVLSIPFQGASTTRSGKVENVPALEDLFKNLKERGISSLDLADYSITQLSDHFAAVRMRWELSDTDGQVKNTVMSTYVIRLEEPGWRVVTILEMGAPHGP